MASFNFLWLCLGTGRTLLKLWKHCGLDFNYHMLRLRDLGLTVTIITMWLRLGNDRGYGLKKILLTGNGK